MYKQKILIIALALVLTCLVFADPPQWTPMIGNQYNMQVYAQVTLYEQQFNDDNPDNMLAAFGPEGEDDCRAIAVWDQVGPYAMWYLTVRSNAESSAQELISFMIYDAQSDEVYECRGEYLIYFADNSVAGSLYEPYQLYAPANLPPVSMPNEYSLMEDSLLTVSADDGVLSNDYDPEGLSLTAVLIEDVPLGILVFNEDGSFTYQPYPDFFGLVHFTYQAFDGELYGDETLVTITVEPVNDPPVFQFPPQGFVFDEDQSLIEDFSLYITDPEGDVIIDLSASPTQNIIIDIAGLVVMFSAPENWFGSEIVTFTATDIHGASNSEDVIITVNPINDPPSIDIPFDQIVMDEDTQELLDLSDYISDIDSDSLTLTVSDNDNITVIINGFLVSLIPDQDWFGSEVLNFVVTDEYLLSDNDFLEIVVLPVNDPPVINIPEDEYFFPEDESLTLDLSDSIYDVDDDILEISFSGNTDLVISEISFAVFYFTAPPNWFGSELLTFTVQDPEGLEDSDDVIITVIAVNDPPVIILPDSFTLPEDTTLTIDFALEGYVYDVDSDNLTLTGNGININVNINGLIVEFIPLPNWFGTENITFTVSDQEFQVSDNVDIIITPVNDPPVIDLEDSFTFYQEETLEVDFSLYVFDVDNDELVLTAAGNENILVDINQLMVTFSAVPGWNGSEFIVFTVDDNQGRAVASDTTQVIVLPVDLPPVFELPQVISMYEDIPLQVDFSQYITDDGDYLALSADPVDNIAINIDSLMVTFVPDPNWFGVRNATFTVFDGVHYVSDSVDINVIPVNDPPQINLPPEFVFNPNQIYNINFINYVFDIDGDPLSLSFTGNQNIDIQTNGLVVTFNTSDWLGVERVTFTVDDGEATSSDFVDLVVTQDVLMPVIYLPDNFSFNEDFSLNVDFNQYIFNASNIQFDLTASGNQNIFVDINPLNNQVIFSAVTNWFGTEDITFTIYAPDYDYYHSDQTTVIVNPVNDPPVINLPVGGFSFLEDTSLVVNFNLGSGYISDVDSDPVLINITANEPTPHINVDLIDNIATFTAPLNWNGAENFTISANDGQIIVQEVFTVTVTPVNDPPTINLPPAGFSFPENSSLLVDFEPFIDDVDGDVLSIVLVNEPDNIFTGISAYSVNFSSTQYWNGSEPLVFSVNDHQGRAIALDTVMVYVTPINNPPYVQNPLPDLEIPQDSSDNSFNLNLVFADYDLDPNLNAVITDYLTFSYSEPGEQAFNISINQGIVTISPFQNWVGQKTLSFFATDSGGLTAMDSAVVTVTAVNYPPQLLTGIPNFDKLEDFEDFSIDLDIYFYDQNGDVLQYVAQFDPLQVVAQIEGSILTISSLLNWNGQAGIIVIASDPEGLSVSDGFVVNVAPVNDPPQLNLPDTFYLMEDITYTSDFSMYAIDVDGDDLIIFNDPTQNIDISYDDDDPLLVHITGAPDWFGQETVVFYASDQTGRLIDSDSVIIDVAPVNDPPQIILPTEGFTFAEDNSLVVDFSSYVSDIDSDILTIISTGGNNINAEINGFYVTLSASLNWFGSEIIEFSVFDGEFYDSDTAPVTVTPVNDPPVISLPDSFTTPEDNPLTVNFGLYISDVDNDIEDIDISTIGTHPNVSILIEGAIVTFTPNLNYFGTINIGFLADDNAGGTASDFVDLIVTPVNDPPTIDLPDSFSFDEDESLQVNFAPYIDDVDGDELFLYSINADNITVVIDENMVTFFAPLDWYGSETITFSVDDGQDRATAQDDVEVIVNPVNDAPVINLPEQFSFNEDASTAIDFLSYVYDVDTSIDDLALSVSGNTNIIVEIDVFNVLLTAPQDWSGSETITFTVYETNTRLQDSDDVLVIVHPVNDPPTINLPTSVNISEGGSLPLNFAEYINDVDNDYSELVISTEGNEYLNIDIDGMMVVLEAFSHFNGTILVEFTVSDYEYNASDAMSVVILPVNDPPDINLPEQFTAYEDIPLTIDFNEYVFDVDGDQLSLSVSGNENIMVIIDGLAVTILGDLNWYGEEMLYFTVDDNVTRLTDTDSVMVVVLPVNDAPVINLPASIIAIENTLDTFDFSEYIYDVDGDPLTLTYAGNSLIDSIIVDGLVITIVDDLWMGSENVLFTVSDGLISSSDVVNITLVPAGQIPSPGDVVITLPNIDGLEFGDEFMMPINVNVLLEIWEVYGFEFNLIFDPAILEFLGWNLENTIIDTTRLQVRDNFISYDQDDPIFGAGNLINLEFKYISTEYEQDVVDLDDFEFHTPSPFKPVVFDCVVNNDFPYVELALANQILQEDFDTVSIDLQNHFFDNTPGSPLEFSVSSASPHFAVTIDQSILSLISIQDKYTEQFWDVTVVCYDRFLYSVRDTFSVFINPVNDPPVIYITDQFIVATDQLLHVNFNNYITDVDNDVDTEVTINIENVTDITGSSIQLIPFTFNAEDKTAIFTGPHNWTGLNQFEITAYDPADSSSTFFDVSVVYLGSNDIHCYPNPMNTNEGTNFVINSVTTLADIKIDIYDFAGRKVCSNSFSARGANEIKWMGYTDGWNGSKAGSKLARGVYFARVVAKDDYGAVALEKIVKLAIKE
jgi:hypothetical protein